MTPEHGRPSEDRTRAREEDLDRAFEFESETPPPPSRPAEDLRTPVSASAPVLASAFSGVFGFCDVSDKTTTPLPAT